MDQTKIPTEKPKIKSSILDDLEENTRFDRWIEFISAIILALATLGTAWCGYQANLWNGEKSNYSTAANSANLQAAHLSNRAILVDSRNVDLFVEWSAAITVNNQKLADYLFERFPPELMIATEAWLALDPSNNPDAPLTPFDMPEYQLEDLEKSEALLAQVEVNRDKASEASNTADRYVLLTVLFASVLFFGGISGKFKSQVIDLGMLGMAALMFLIILAILISYPIL